MSCKYEGCWENVSFQKRSPYCHLHQKIIKNSMHDLFTKLSQRISETDWKFISKIIIDSDYTVSIGDFSELVLRYSKYKVTPKDKEYFYEAFKAE